MSNKTHFLIEWQVFTLFEIDTEEKKHFRNDTSHFGCKTSNAVEWHVEHFSYNRKALLKCVGLVWFGFVLFNKTLCFQCFAK